MREGHDTAKRPELDLYDFGGWEDKTGDAGGVYNSAAGTDLCNNEDDYSDSSENTYLSPDDTDGYGDDNYTAIVQWELTGRFYRLRDPETG